MLFRSQNGKVLVNFALSGDHRRFDAEGEVAIPQGGWLLLRAWNDGADPQVLDLYPYATTNPVYLSMAGGVPPASDDAAYFATWIGRAIEAMQARDDFNDENEKRDTLDYLSRARDAYRALSLASGKPSP